jgi:hypothetical protein
VGSVCWGNSTPVTRRQAEGRVTDHVVRYIPALRPGFDPPGGSLTSVPVIFWTGQPTSFRPPNFSLSGHLVSITAKPTWRWTWGDGSSVWKSVAGAPLSKSPNHPPVSKSWKLQCWSNCGLASPVHRLGCGHF